MTSTEIPTPPPAPPLPEADNLLRRWFGPSWRTGLAGALSFVCAAVAGLSAAQPALLPPLVVTLAGVLGPLIGSVGLYHAKDAKVTGAS